MSEWGVNSINKFRILVGQLVDADNNNAQCLNARAILSYASILGVEWIVPHYGAPDPALLNRDNIHLIKLWKKRLWQWHKFLLYLYPVDAIFYPGVYWFDTLALQLREICGRKVPVISTVEGLAGDLVRSKIYSKWAGHPVYCQLIPPKLIKNIDQVTGKSRHVIAISPFLKKMGRRRFGDKFSVIPLGVDGGIFNPCGRSQPSRFRVVGAGRLYDNKRPHLFVQMAKNWPQADFVWFGDGELQKSLFQEIFDLRLNNISFPGSIANKELAQEFKKSSLFVLPSKSEGVPKVTQEAASCGLPVIIFGFYEAPSVIDGENGFVVWNDNELFERVGELIENPDKAIQMGRRGVEMAADWMWDKVAPRWEETILRMI